jgi:thiol-disulfide isomerase/thioredoxin
LEELTKLKSLTNRDTSENIILKDTNGISQNLHNFAKLNDYTLIIFFDPNCEHCKVDVPKMDSVVKLFEYQFVKKIGKYAICNEQITQPEIWKNFINNYHLINNYIHVTIGENNDVRKAYDAYSNPIFYLIDKDGRFISKKLGINSFRSILLDYIQSNN